MKQKSVLFVCLGNICRSPMAQTVFEKMIADKGIQDQFIVDSAGLHSYHEGDKADPRMRDHAKRRNYNIAHLSRPVVPEDFDKFDIIVAMDEQNIKGLKSIAQTDEHLAKIHRMADYLNEMEADYIPDPYYGGAKGFEHVIDLLEDAMDGFLKSLED